MLFLFFFSRVNLHAFNFAFTQHTPSLAAPPPPHAPLRHHPVCLRNALWEGVVTATATTKRRWMQPGREQLCCHIKATIHKSATKAHWRVSSRFLLPGRHGGCYVVVFLLHRWNGIEARTSSEAGDNLFFFSIITPPPYFPLPPTIHSLHQSALAGDSRQSYLSDFVLHQGCGDWK